MEWLAVLGGSWLVARVGPEPNCYPGETVFTSTRDRADVVANAGRTLEQVLTVETISYHASNKSNGDRQAIDFIRILLPENRGGAHCPWMILDPERPGPCNFQVALGGGETVHHDPLLRVARYEPPASRMSHNYSEGGV